ncbi:MAG: arginine decarboxylase, pyruvoyl-dependent [Candidatus Aminicenantes bacterium]|nr:arginine decarboxylase, pyruvoyl-dependent [Candidatus Aminicenantes bacterium]
MSKIIPTKVFLTKGIGQHKEKLASFEQSLRMAGIAPFNLVKTSSIFPPHCKLVSREEGLKLLSPGQVVFLVMSECVTDEPHRMICASVGLAIPNDPKHYGYLSEHHGFGQKEKEAGRYAEDLAADMLATTLGMDFDTSQIWDENKNFYRISDKLTVRTRNATQMARGKKGLWTTAIAAAIFIP